MTEKLFTGTLNKNQNKNKKQNFLWTAEQFSGLFKNNKKYVYMNIFAEIYFCKFFFYAKIGNINCLGK